MAAIPAGARQRIAFERVEIEPEQTIYEAGAELTHYVFPIVGTLSLVKDLDGATIEVGTVGHEGMVGIPGMTP